MRGPAGEAAGSNEQTFQNGWVRDRAEDGSPLDAAASKRLGLSCTREGMRLDDFKALPMARKARLDEAHVVALRLYS